MSFRSWRGTFLLYYVGFNGRGIIEINQKSPSVPRTTALPTMSCRVQGVCVSHIRSLLVSIRFFGNYSIWYVRFSRYPKRVLNTIFGISRIRSNVWTDPCYSDNITFISKTVTFEIVHTIRTFLFNAYIHVLLSLLKKFRCLHSSRRGSLLLYWGSSKALSLVVVVRTPLCRVPVACFHFKLNSGVQDQTVIFDAQTMWT